MVMLRGRSLASARSEEWLDRESSAFREGYLQTANLHAIVMTAPQPPFRLPLPNPGRAR